MTVVARRVAGYGWRPDLPDPRDRIFGMENPTLSSSDPRLPLVFSLRKKMPSIFDQLALGSCTANGIVAVLMKQGMDQGEAELMLARLFVYYYERVIEGSVNEDSGAQIRDGIKVIAKMGAPPESELPYDISKFTEKPSAKVIADAKKHVAIEYLRVLAGGPGSVIRTPILAGHPVVFGFSVPERFEDPSWDPATEMLPLPDGEGFIGGHCTVVVGWDFSLKRFPVNVFEIRNSWSSRWGDQGHFWMDARWLYEPQRQLSSDFWVVRRAS